MKKLRKIAVITAISMLCTPSAFNITYADTDDQSAELAAIYEFENPIPETDFILLDETLSTDDSTVIEGDDLPPKPEMIVDQNDGHTIYLIDSADDLIYVREHVRQNTDKSFEYRLTADIDLGGMEWEPIGFPTDADASTTAQELQAAAFHGIFDGNNHTISNFKITDSKYFRAGFFATLYGAAVYDLNLTDFDINLTYTSDNEYASSAIGGLAGYSLHSCIFNCNISGNITVNSSSFGLDSSEKESSVIAIGLAVGDMCAALQFDEKLYDNIEDYNKAAPRLIENVKTSGGITAVQNPVSDSEELSPILRVGGVVGALLPVSQITASNTADAINLTSDAVIDAYSSHMLDLGGIVGYAAQTGITIANCKYIKKDDTDNSSEPVAVDEADELNSAEDNPQLFGKSGKGLSVGGIAGKSQCLFKNCNVENVDIQGTSLHTAYIGGVSGNNIKGKIENCSSSANLSSDEINDATVSIYIGGISALNGSAGTATRSPSDIFPKISSCTFDGSIYAGRGKNVKSSIGFICGSNSAEGIISDCTVKTANMSIAQTGLLIYIGGISGINEGGTIERCVNYQDINLTDTSGAIYLGGISGSCTKGIIKIYTDENKTDTNTYTYGGKIRDCYNEADLTLTSAAAVYLGGFAGYLTGQAICDNGQPRIERCYTKGNVTANVTAKVTVLQGGACGYILDSEVTDCYSESNVALNLSDAAAAATAFASGFGRVKQNATNIEFPNSIVWNCYASGTVTVSDNATNTKKGGFVSDLSNNNPKNSPDITTLLPIVRDNYYLSDDPNADKSIATPLTAEQFTDINSFSVSSSDDDTLWDFNDVWYMSETGPRLLFETQTIYAFEYTTENNQNTSIDKVILSKPTANSKLYFAAYASNGTLLDFQSADVSEEDCQNNEFASIELDTPYEIPVLAQSVKVFAWDNDMSPLTDVKAASLTAE